MVGCKRSLGDPIVRRLQIVGQPARCLDDCPEGFDIVGFDGRLCESVLGLHGKRFKFQSDLATENGKIDASAFTGPKHNQLASKKIKGVLSFEKREGHSGLNAFHQALNSISHYRQDRRQNGDGVLAGLLLIQDSLTALQVVLKRGIAETGRDGDDRANGLNPSTIPLRDLPKDQQEGDQTEQQQAGALADSFEHLRGLAQQPAVVQ